MATMQLVPGANDHARPNASARQSLDLLIPLIDLLAWQIAAEEVARMTAANTNELGPHAAP